MTIRPYELSLIRYISKYNKHIPENRARMERYATENGSSKASLNLRSQATQTRLTSVQSLVVHSWQLTKCQITQHLLSLCNHFQTKRSSLKQSLHFFTFKCKMYKTPCRSHSSSVMCKYLVQISKTTCCVKQYYSWQLQQQRAGLKSHHRQPHDKVANATVNFSFIWILLYCVVTGVSGLGDYMHKLSAFVHG